MSFVDAIKSGFSKYVTFSGRAYRSEYWYWVLFVVIASLVALTLDSAILGYSPSGASPITGIFDLVTFLPSLALAARRLHDMDRTAWWLLITFTGIGSILLIIWFCFRGTQGPNRFGPDLTPAG
ncbi:MAG: DUF805 domain-containing protein [Xanthobacteraceae bacterium]|jgi:uncharacterized membrane protein YhaH (DUF805 family)